MTTDPPGASPPRGSAFADASAARHRSHAGFLVQLDEHAVLTVCAETRDSVRPLEHAQADHRLVVRDRAIEVGDLQSHATDVRVVGQAVPGWRDAVRARGGLQVGHWSPPRLDDASAAGVT